MVCDGRAHTVSGVIVSPLWLEGQSASWGLAPWGMSIIEVISVALETIPVRVVM